MKKDIVFFFVLVLMIIYWLIDSKISEKNRIEHCIKSCKRDKELSISGIIVDKKYIGVNSKGIKTIFILQKVGDTVKYYSSWHRDLDFVEIGDSLLKKSGSFDFKIFRKGKLLIQILAENQDCDCLCSDNPRECIEKQIKISR